MWTCCYCIAVLCVASLCPVIYNTQSDLSKPLHMEDIDSSSGLLIPFFDADTNVVYVAGKVLCMFKMYDISYRWKT